MYEYQDASAVQKENVDLHPNCAHGVTASKTSDEGPVSRKGYCFCVIKLILFL